MKVSSEGRNAGWYILYGKLCSPVQKRQLFSWTCCVSLQDPSRRGRTFLRNVDSFLSNYTASLPRVRQLYGKYKTLSNLRLIFVWKWVPASDISIKQLINSEQKNRRFCTRLSVRKNGRVNNLCCQCNDWFGRWLRETDRRTDGSLGHPIMNWFSAFRKMSQNMIWGSHSQRLDSRKTSFSFKFWDCGFWRWCFWSCCLL